MTRISGYYRNNKYVTTIAKDLESFRQIDNEYEVQVDTFLLDNIISSKVKKGDVIWFEVESA